MSAYLERLETAKKSHDTRLPLTDRWTVIGRARPAQLVIRRPEVSRTHAVIVKRSGRFYLKDVGSKNGTARNGTVVRQARLRDGDVIRIGLSVLRFRDPELTPEEAFEVVE